nr:hypothetical protein Itr_chr15CG15510 [Ipomoea trifida]
MGAAMGSSKGATAITARVLGAYQARLSDRAPRGRPIRGGSSMLPRGVWRLREVVEAVDDRGQGTTWDACLVGTDRSWMAYTWVARVELLVV